MAFASPSFDSTSSDMVSRLRARDAMAWDRMAELYAPLVFYWCRRSNLQQADAADVVQDVFASVATAIEGYESRSGSNFRGWLWMITRNKINDHFRGRQRDGEAAGGTSANAQFAQVPAEGSGYAPSDADDADRHEFSALLHRGLENVKAEFADRTWRAFWRSAVEGDTTADVAAELGITANAVRQAKSRVLRRLRDELGDDQVV